MTLYALSKSNLVKKINHKSQTHQHEDLRPQLPEEPLDSEYRYEREDVARTISPRQTTRTTTDPYLMLFLMID